MRIRAASTKSQHKDNPFDELKQNFSATNEEFFNLIKEHLPYNPETHGIIVAQKISEGDKIFTPEEIESKLKSLAEEGYVTVEENPIFGKTYRIKE